MSLINSIPGIPDPYRVHPGDTLSGIARRCGQSVGSLQRWNALPDPNRLEVGHSLFLSEESAFGISALFLDALRHPIENLPFRVSFDGKTVEGKTGPEGTVPRQVTASAQSEVKVWVQDLSGSWQSIMSTASGVGHKLLTLVSNALVVTGETRELPKGVDTKPESSKENPKRPAGSQPEIPKPTTGTPSKNNPAVKTRKIKGPKGQPIIKVEVDIPQGLLQHFAHFRGEPITDKDWGKAAALVECDSAVLKAFAEVESGGRNSFWRLNQGDGASIPAVLFERHYFSKLTGRRFDKSYPDLSWKIGYRKKDRLGAADKKMSDGRIDGDDVYGDYASAYLRLINAYRLDPEAALKSCSWGKFQIMGDNFKLCDADSIDLFVKAMCTSEAAQIMLVCEFIREKPASWKDAKNKSKGKEITLWDSVKTKNWQAIAFNYNGPEYKTYNYDAKLKKAYEKYAAS